MLLGVEDQTLDILKKMEQSEFNFHLTGSRFFGTAGGASDWDFFVLDTPETRLWLSEKGFKEGHNNNYCDDPNLASVFQLGMIHVQLVPDTLTKSIVQSALAKAGTLQYAGNKRVARQYWKLGYALLESILENVPQDVAREQ